MLDTEYGSGTMLSTENVHRDILHVSHDYEAIVNAMLLHSVTRLFYPYPESKSHPLLRRQTTSRLPMHRDKIGGHKLVEEIVPGSILEGASSFSSGAANQSLPQILERTHRQMNHSS